MICTASIESYRITVRSDDRPKDLPDAIRRRAGSDGTPRAPLTGVRGEKVLSVTVSIGLSERKSGQNPSDALRDADKALYRAKEAGRNRVGR